LLELLVLRLWLVIFIFSCRLSVLLDWRLKIRKWNIREILNLKFCIFRWFQWFFCEFWYPLWLGLIYKNLWLCQGVLQLFFPESKEWFFLYWKGWFWYFWDEFRPKSQSIKGQTLVETGKPTPRDYFSRSWSFLSSQQYWGYCWRHTSSAFSYFQNTNTQNQLNSSCYHSRP
jgi:hypothetical protein